MLRLDGESSTGERSGANGGRRQTRSPRHARSRGPVPRTLSTAYILPDANRPPMARVRGRLYGTVLLVRSIRASVAFYQGALGLDGDVAGPWAEFRRGAGRLMLFERRFWAETTSTAPCRPPQRHNPREVIGIRVPDVTHVHRRLRESHVPFDSPPITHPVRGVRIARLRDPDGHVIELTSRLAAQDRAGVRRGFVHSGRWARAGDAGGSALPGIEGPFDRRSPPTQAPLGSAASIRRSPGSGGRSSRWTGAPREHVGPLAGSVPPNGG